MSESRRFVYETRSSNNLPDQEVYSDKPTLRNAESTISLNGEKYVKVQTINPPPDEAKSVPQDTQPANEKPNPKNRLAKKSNLTRKFPTQLPSPPPTLKLEAKSLKFRLQHRLPVMNVLCSPWRITNILPLLN